jgi:uncharacterized protein YndB with AHSA1/START domain
MTETMRSEERHFTVTRILDAPVERVWRAWTTAEDVRRWWGPQGFTAPVAEMDVREGGRSLVAMRSPEGQDLYNTWTYRNIVPNERFEFITRFADAEGRTMDPVALGLPAELPQGVRSLVTLRALDGGRTELSVTEYGYTSEDVMSLSRRGLEECLDKMADLVAGG